MSIVEGAIRRFCEFSEEEPTLDGDKIRLDDILNIELVITGYKISGSKYGKNKSGKCLTLQIEVDGKKRVMFTGSDVLIGQIERYSENIPFMTSA